MNSKINQCFACAQQTELSYTKNVRLLCMARLLNRRLTIITSSLCFIFFDVIPHFGLWLGLTSQTKNSSSTTTTTIPWTHLYNEDVLCLEKFPLWRSYSNKMILELLARNTHTNPTTYISINIFESILSWKDSDFILWLVSWRWAEPRYSIIDADIICSIIISLYVMMVHKLKHNCYWNCSRLETEQRWNSANFFHTKLFQGLLMCWVRGRKKMLFVSSS